MLPDSFIVIKVVEVDTFLCLFLLLLLLKMVWKL